MYSSLSVYENYENKNGGDKENPPANVLVNQRFREMLGQFAPLG